MILWSFWSDTVDLAGYLGHLTALLCEKRAGSAWRSLANLPTVFNRVTSERLPLSRLAALTGARNALTGSGELPGVAAKLQSFSKAELPAVNYLTAAPSTVFRGHVSPDPVSGLSGVHASPFLNVAVGYGTGNIGRATAPLTGYNSLVSSFSVPPAQRYGIGGSVQSSLPGSPASARPVSMHTIPEMLEEVAKSTKGEIPVSRLGVYHYGVGSLPDSQSHFTPQYSAYETDIGGYKPLSRYLTSANKAKPDGPVNLVSALEVPFNTGNDNFLTELGRYTR